MYTAHTPQWADAAHTLINLTWVHDTLGEIPFGASPNDIELHGRELFAKALAGDFGTVAEYVPPIKTPEQIKKELTDAVQQHLDNTAKTRGYDGILSLASYATSTNPTFSAEGQAGVVWRDAVWAYCYQVLADVQTNNRPVPTAEALIAELPTIAWP